LAIGNNPNGRRDKCGQAADILKRCGQEADSVPDCNAKAQVVADCVIKYPNGACSDELTSMETQDFLSCVGQ